MSEKNGFRNCPEITEFQRGMEIVRNPYPARRIVSVDALGEGLMDNAVYIHPHDKSEWTLKLDGVWEGQVRKSDTSLYATVKAISGDYEWVACVRRDGCEMSLQRERFQCGYPTVVLPKPKPTLESVVREATARGWCYPSNASKVMDCNLAEAITAEVVRALKKAGVRMPREKTDAV